MKLQTASRLGLYAVLELAADPARQRSAAEIAEIHGVSLNHLAKVLRDLSRAGLVEAVRGVGGGYRFCGNARRTTLMDVIRIFEDLGDSGPANGDAGAATPTEAAIALVLKEIDDTIGATLQSITIDTMVKLIARQPR